MKFLLLSILFFSLPSMAFENFQIGPSLKIIDVPHPAQVGLDARLLDGYLGLSVHKGLMPAVNIDKYDVKLDNSDIGIKFHPWQGSFYVGALMGSQEVSFKGVEEIKGQIVNIQGKVKSKYLTPHVGWQWRYDSGFYMGIHLGWQISSEAKTSISAASPNLNLLENTQEYKDAKKDLEDQGNDLGNKALPSVGLFQIGWMF